MGHRTNNPAEDNAISEATAPENIHLGMFAAVHNDLKVIAVDIGSAYLHMLRLRSYILFLEIKMENCEANVYCLIKAWT